MILVENPGSNTFEFQDLSKIVKLAKKKKSSRFLIIPGELLCI